MLAPAAADPLDVEPLALDCAPGVEALAPPLAAGAAPPAALVLPEALPEPEDWLVCAPWFIVEDGLVVVALWLAEVLLETFWSPVPTFTPGLILALALTSPEGAVLLPDALLGCEDCVVCELWSVDDDCAYAEPNTPITAAAVILTAT